MALAQLTKVALADDRVHHAPTGRDDDLQLHLRLARGEIELRYSAAIEPFIIDGFAGSLGAVLAAFEHLDTPVGDIASAPPEDGPLLAAFNETATTGPSHPTVVAMFEAQVARTPTAPALVTDSALMTYADLNARANSLAHQLREHHGVGPESLVGIMLDRSEWMIVAILGILKAGAAFVPLDPAYPAERINHILGDTGLSLLVTQSNQLAQWYEFSGVTLLLDETPAGRRGRTTRRTVPNRRTSPTCSTSGSTGKPKGCLLEHRPWPTTSRGPPRITFRKARPAVSACTARSASISRSPISSARWCARRCASIRSRKASTPSWPDVPARQRRRHPQAHAHPHSPAGIHEPARAGVRKVIVSGEELTPQHIATLRKIDPAIEIYNVRSHRGDGRLHRRARRGRAVDGADRPAHRRHPRVHARRRAAAGSARRARKSASPAPASRAATTSGPTSPPRNSSSIRSPAKRASIAPATSAGGCPTDVSSATGASTARSRSAGTVSNSARSRPRSPRTRMSSARRSCCANPPTGCASWRPTSGRAEPERAGPAGLSGREAAGLHGPVRHHPDRRISAQRQRQAGSPGAAGAGLTPRSTTPVSMPRRSMPRRFSSSWCASGATCSTIRPSISPAASSTTAAIRCKPCSWSRGSGAASPSRSASTRSSNSRPSARCPT